MYQLRDLAAELHLKHQEDIFNMEIGRLTYDLLEKDMNILIPNQMKKFTDLQRLEILRCITHDLDYEPLIRYDFNAKQMYQLRQFIINNYDISLICDPDIPARSMELVSKAYRKGLSLSRVNIKLFSPEQLNQIIFAIQMKLDIKSLLDPTLTEDEMRDIRNKLAEHSTIEKETTDKYRGIHKMVFGG